MHAIMPLICRDPLSFLNAVATTVAVETKGRSSDGNPIVSLFSPEESTLNAQAVSEVIRSKEASAAVDAGRRGPPLVSNGAKAATEAQIRVMIVFQAINRLEEEQCCSSSPDDGESAAARPAVSLLLARCLDQVYN